LELKPEIHLKQTQKLVMTPQLQQAIKMLQLSNLELNEQIEQELIENPALDIEEQEREYELSEQDINKRVEKTSDEKTTEELNEEYFYLERSYPKNQRDSGEDKKREFLEGAVSREETLREYLLQQLHMLKIDPDEFEAAEVLINYINPEGYLSRESEEIASDFGMNSDVVKKALTTVQTLDPPGVGARDIRECLLIQLRNRGDYPVAEKIILDYMNELKLKKYDEVAKKCGISRTVLDRMLEIISGLEPYPGRQFYTEGIRYIIPDVIVEKGEDGFQVIANSSSIPRLRVNNYFERLMKLKRNDRRVRDFVNDRVQRAKSFIHAVQQRESTLVRVTEAILNKQMDFFERGSMYLKPMTLKDIAQVVDLHESTISRITSSKYIQTPLGVYSLKYFFSSSIPAKGSEDLSSTSIKEIIKGIVNNEGSKMQLSDQKITDLLAKRGIKIARRTVAKYRKELQILPSNLRRS